MTIKKTTKKQRLRKDGQPWRVRQKVPFSEASVKEAVTGSLGDVSVVATRLKCSWIKARQSIDEHPAAKAIFDQENEKLCAMAVSSLAKAVSQGERWAIERILETRARKSGFGVVQHIQTDVTSGGQVIKSEQQVIKIVDLTRKPATPDAAD